MGGWVRAKAADDKPYDFGVLVSTRTDRQTDRPPGGLDSYVDKVDTTVIASSSKTIARSCLLCVCGSTLAFRDITVHEIAKRHDRLMVLLT